MSKTKKPTGLNIQRNGWKFTASWKIADADYANGQQFQYSTDGGKTWKSLSVGVKDTSKAFTVDSSKFHPNKKGKYLKSVMVRVRGNRKAYKKKVKKKETTINPGWSEWSKQTFTISVPNIPTITAELDGTLSNKTTFSWNTDTSDTDHKMFTRTYWESLLIKDNPSDDGKEIKFSKANAVIDTDDKTTWQSGQSTKGNSVYFEEDTTLLAAGSYTRWIRIQSVGASGNTDWHYGHHTYAKPNTASVTDKDVKTNAGGDGYEVTIKWDADANTSRPIDSNTVEYAIVTPVVSPTTKQIKPLTGHTFVSSQYELALGIPTGTTWDEAKISADTAGSDMARYEIDSVLGVDQALFQRVITKHDTDVSRGASILTKSGMLEKPELATVDVNNTTHTATITATNKSAISGSFMSVMFYSDSYPDGLWVGVIPSGQTSVTVRCPDWSKDTYITFGVKAIVGVYSYAVRSDERRDFALYSELMHSEIVTQGGAVPQSPSDVKASATNISGTIRVSWNSSWAEADGAQISWSDHSDAWESTDEPEDYTITNLQPTHWNISGLETGVTWYIRVRLLKGTGENITYGPWSDITDDSTVDLASAPSKPVLNVPNAIVTEDGVVNCSWVYSTTDGTAQSYAEVAEVTFEDDEPVFNPIKHVETAQSLSISVKDDTDWQTGQTYYIAVRVRSASGRLSDEWSDLVPITVAEPLSAEITQTSLEYRDVEVNPRSMTGNPIEFETEISEDFVKLEVSLEPQQDLHGYDHPWVGGAGKNKLPPTGTNTISGITYKVASDGTVSLTGTATAENGLTISFTVTETGNYYFNGCADGGGYNSNYDCYLWDATNGRRAYKWDGTTSSDSAINSSQSREIRLESGVNYQYRIRVRNGFVASGQVFYPMVRLSTESATYEPYSNICPISGWDEVNVTRAGKNLNVFPYYHSSRTNNGVTYTVNSDGTVTANGTATAASVFTCNFRGTGNLFLKAGRYILSGCPSGGGISTYIMNANYMVNGVGINYAGNDTGNGMTFNVTEDTVVGVFITIANGTTVSNLTFKPMVRLASDADSPYEPYQGNTYTSELPQTVYGGTVDLVSGLLTVDRAMVDLGGLSWTRNNSEYSYPYFYSQELSNCSYIPDMLCDRYPVVNGGKGNLTTDNTLSFYSSVSTRIAIRNDSYTDATTFKTSLSGAQLVYKLATSQTYQLTPQQIHTLLGTNNVWSDSGNMAIRISESYRSQLSLTELPLTITVTGAGENGITRVAVERSEDYPMDRPDENTFNGFKGETVILTDQTGEDQIVIERDSEALIGFLDDGAPYEIVATVQDGLGQSSEARLPFEVHWDKQAVIPDGTAEIDEEALIAKITPTKPVGGDDADSVDIYRLSADRPQLIYEGAQFGETIVDPYPAIGEFGGHRLVYRTVFGDYITMNNEIAWIDLDDNYDLDQTIIDFDGDRVVLQYGMNVSYSWEKDFTRTKYLGGSVQGDWNPAITRSGQITASLLTQTESETIESLRRLATYAGPCHVRTKEGSSFTADVQCSENDASNKYGEIVQFTLNVNAIDPEVLDGVTLDEWEEEE